VQDMPTPDEVGRRTLTGLVKARAKAVIGALVDQDLLRHMTAPGLLDPLAKIGASEFGAHVAADIAMTQIEAALNDVDAAFLP